MGTCSHHPLSLHDALPICFLRNGLSTPWRFKAGDGIRDIAVRGSLHLSNGTTLRTAALDGIGLTRIRSEEHTSELQSPCNLVCRLLLEENKGIYKDNMIFN